MTTKAKVRALSEDLDMMASQLREYLDDEDNRPPTPFRFDDWFTEYRDIYPKVRRLRRVPNDDTY